MSASSHNSSVDPDVRRDQDLEDQKPSSRRSSLGRLFAWLGPSWERETFDAPTLADFHATAFELVGTVVFLFIAYMGCELVNTNSMLDSRATSTDRAGYASELTTLDVYLCASSFGLGLLVAVCQFNDITGAAFNPAVCIALLYTGTIKFWRCVLFIVAQMVGAIIAAALTLFFAPRANRNLSVLNKLSPGYDRAQGIFLEAIGTAIFVFTILRVAVEPSRGIVQRGTAPIYIAFTLLALHIVLIPKDGCSVNPARSFGPSAVAGRFPDQEVFWIGPIVGALVAAITYRHTQSSALWSFGNTELSGEEVAAVLNETPASPTKEASELPITEMNSGSSGQTIPISKRNPGTLPSIRPFSEFSVLGTSSDNTDGRTPTNLDGWATSHAEKL